LPIFAIKNALTKLVLHAKVLSKNRKIFNPGAAEGGGFGIASSASPPLLLLAGGALHAACASSHLA